MKLLFCISTVLLLATAPAEAATANVGSAAPEGSLVAQPATAKHRTAVYVGFGHWYGDTFGAPLGVNTPAISVGFSPASWLESRIRYSLSLVKLDLPSNARSHVGFASLEALFGSELRAEGQRVRMGGGPLVGFVHTRDGVGIAYGAALSARYLIDAGHNLALGPYLDARAFLYHLPNSSQPIHERDDGKVTAEHSDAQLDLGVAVSFW